MNIRFFLLFIFAFGLFLDRLLSQNDAVRLTVQDDVFRCANLFDRVAIEVQKGSPTVEIEFDKESNQKAIEALFLLKTQVVVSCIGKDSNRSLIGLVGHFTGVKIQSTIKNNAPESEKFIFHLKGWYIQTPFYEYPDSPEGTPQVPPVKRMELTSSDFGSSPTKVLVKRGESNPALYGVGQFEIKKK